MAGKAVGDLAGGIEDLDLDVGSVRGHGGGAGGVCKGGGGGGEIGGCACDEGAEGKVVEDFTAVPVEYGVRKVGSGKGSD